MAQTPNEVPDYSAPKPKTSRKLYWIVGGVVLGLILLGTCVRAGVSAFSAVAERMTATHDIAQTFLTDGLPAADDSIYARRAGVTPEAVDQLNRLIKMFGKLESVGTAACTVQSVANTNPAKAGTFANCSLTAKAEFSPAHVAVVWVREDKIWKIYAFNVQYTDQSVLLDKAERADEAAEEAAGEGDTGETGGD